MRNEGLPESKFAEHIDDGLHGRLVGDSDRCHVQDAVQGKEVGRPGGWASSASEVHYWLAGDSVHCTASVGYKSTLNFYEGSYRTRYIYFKEE